MRKEAVRSIPDPLRWLAVFGGAGNVVSLDAVAATRLRIVVRDPSAVDRQRLATLDTAWISADTFHIVVGDAAQRYAEKLATRTGAKRRCNAFAGMTQR